MTNYKLNALILLEGRALSLYIGCYVSWIVLFDTPTEQSNGQFHFLLTDPVSAHSYMLC
jgi:hypothetical protein